MLNDKAHKGMNNKRRIGTSIVLSISLLLLVFLEYYWQQISGIFPPIGLLAGMILAILVIWKFVSTGLTAFKQRSNLSRMTVVPTVIYFMTIVLIYFNPEFLHASSYQGEVKYRGCYEGTMNTGTILFRESGKFEYRHVGWFGSTTFENGTWKQSGDTLLIDFEKETHEFVGSKLLLAQDRFIKIEGDSLVTERWGFTEDSVKD